MKVCVIGAGRMGRRHVAAAGEILIDGCNVKDYDLLELRRKIGIVPQETFLSQIEVIISPGKLGLSNLSVYFKNSLGLISKNFPPKECPLPVEKLVKDIL